MSNRKSLTAVALFLALSFTATGASAVDVEATERLVRQTMSSAGISPSSKAARTSLSPRRRFIASKSSLPKCEKSTPKNKSP